MNRRSAVQLCSEVPGAIDIVFKSLSIGPSSLPRSCPSPIAAIPPFADAAVGATSGSRKWAPRAHSINFSVVRALILSVMFSLSGPMPAAEQSVVASYSLKLEYEMRRQAGEQASAEQLSPAVLFGITDLSDRALAAEDRVRAVEQDNQKWKAELSARENLIGELEQALGSQDRTIKLLENQVLQPVRPVSRLPQREIRTHGWGPDGWNPSEFRWDDVRTFVRFPTAAERALTVAVVLLLIYALFLRFRAGNNQQELERDRDRPQARGEKSAPSTRREEATAKPIAAERQVNVDLNDLDSSAPQPPLEFEPTPLAPRAEPAVPTQISPPTVRLTPEDLAQEFTPAPVASMDQSTESAASSPLSRPKRKRADQAALREVDALIAFEHFDDAAEVLAQAMHDNPDNPEYRLRSLYILNALGDHERVASEQSALRAIMDGPMSDTLGRVIETGRGLLPGDPLFESKDTVVPPAAQPPLPSDDVMTLDDGTIDDFNELTFWSDDTEPDDEPPKPN